MKWPRLVASALQFANGAFIVTTGLLSEWENVQRGWAAVSAGLGVGEWVQLGIAAALLLSALGMAPGWTWGRVLGIFAALAYVALNALRVYVAYFYSDEHLHAPRVYLSMFCTFLASELFILVVLFFTWERRSLRPGT